MLKFNPDWEYESPGPIPASVRHEFFQVINRLAGKGNRKATLEHFKKNFASAAGNSYQSSSDASWASSDLERDMDDAMANAARFIDAFYSACVTLRDADPDMPTPDANRINRILAQGEAGYQIVDGRLEATTVHTPVAVPQKLPSLDEQAEELIGLAIRKSDAELRKGQGRQAVSEMLWLLETITTAFKGTATETGTVTGKYFNEIIKEMRAGNLSPHQNQILNSMVSLHGYLSSPSGGGIRHGQDLKNGRATIRQRCSAILRPHPQLHRLPT